MGNRFCSQYICRKKEAEQKDFKEAFPLMTSFQTLETPIEIEAHHQELISRIKSRFDIIDPRENRNFGWYKSVKYNLFFYGKLERQRPIGDCFFYTTQQDDENTPIIVTTHINQHFVFSQRTLILNQDHTAYFGEIKNNIAALPRADGKGTLFSKDFVYEGEFKEGVPNGFGKYRSKCLECVGEFKNGEPFGECIQKTPTQLFLGTVKGEVIKVGFKITAKNKRIPVDFKKQIVTMRQLESRSARDESSIKSQKEIGTKETTTPSY